MIKIMPAVFILSFMFISGCSKNSASPNQSLEAPQQTIKGKITTASSGRPVSGATVTTVPATVTVKSDDSGNYELTNIDAASYTIRVYEPGFKEFHQTGVQLASGQNLSLDFQLNELNWSFTKTDNNEVAAVLYSINSKFTGFSLSDGDIIGAFYDSLGTSACAGYGIWKSPDNVSVALWGDDSQTRDKKEGFLPSETIKWKIKRKSDGKVFDADALYTLGQGVYSINGAIILGSMSIR